MEVITSKENSVYKKTLKLLQKKYRDRENKYIIEGIKILYDYKDVLDVSYILINEDVNNLTINKNIPIYRISNTLFNNLTIQKNSQGVLIVCNKKENDLTKVDNDILVLDNIQDPGNLGTIIRTSSAFGIKDIFITDTSVDEYSLKVLRASMGTIFNVNIHRMCKRTLIDFIKNKCYNVITTTLDKQSVNISEIVISEKNAYIFGNEGNGVSKEFFEISNQFAIIPIENNTESLNVAISVGIVLYEIIKRRTLI